MGCHLTDLPFIVNRYVKNLQSLIFCQPISLTGRHSLYLKKKCKKALLEKFSWARSIRGAYHTNEQ